MRISSLPASSDASFLTVRFGARAHELAQRALVDLGVVVATQQAIIGRPVHLHEATFEGRAI